MSFARKERQRIINGYLNESGSNLFVPTEFLAWLRERPDHEVYSTFFGSSDEDAAMAHRVNLVRRWVSELRINVQFSEPTLSDVGEVTVREYETPAMVSYLSGRKAGGGYREVSADDMPELRLQAATVLMSWLDRFGGVANASGVDVSAITQIVAALEAVDVEIAAT